MVTMKRLRYFTEIVECGSFSLAAERLHVAQSTFSRQIKELEAFVQAVQDDQRGPATRHHSTTV